jgi:PAS domain S-box-containing protein
MYIQLDNEAAAAAIFRSLYAQSAEAMLLIDDERFVACNPAAAALLAYPDTTCLLGAHPADISPALQPDGQPSRAKARSLLAEARRVGSLRFEWSHQRADGQRLPVDVLLTAIELNGLPMLHVAWHDTSDRVRSQKQLERSVQEHREELARRGQITQAMHDILTLLTSDHPLDAILAYLVAHAARLLHADAVTIYQLQPSGQRLRVQAVQGLEAEEIECELALGVGITGYAALERQPVYIDDLPHWLAGRELRPADQQLLAYVQSAGAVPLRVRGEIYGALTIYYRQAHAFAPDEARLLEACADYAALAIENAGLRLQVAQAAAAAERSRLARDLHDAVTQTLFSASLIADVLPRLWARDQAEGWRRLEEVRSLTRGALAEMRALLLELRPDTLVEMPFAELLRQLAAAVGGRAGVPVEVLILPAFEEGRLPPEVQLALYRIVQEALNNAARHAHAQHIGVECRMTFVEQGGGDAATAVALWVRDDGRGFDPALVSPGHLGLQSMGERAQAIGAQLDLHSVLNQGTVVGISWPRPEVSDA